MILLLKLLIGSLIGGRVGLARGCVPGLNHLDVATVLVPVGSWSCGAKAKPVFVRRLAPHTAIALRTS